MANNMFGFSRSKKWHLMLIATLLLSGCRGVQSALDPAGLEALRIFNIFWWMTAGAAVIWLIVIALTFYCARVSPDLYRHTTTKLLIAERVQWFQR
jgi:cytochrome c oxidase subunit 2